MRDPEGSNPWTDLATAGWLDAAAEDIIETPDLRGLDGWNDGFGIHPGDGSVRWTAIGYRSNRGVGEVVDALGLLLGTPPTGGEDAMVLEASSQSGLQ